MDKQKIIKIAIAGIVVVLAIVYYFSTKEENTYDDILASDVVVENKVEDAKQEPEKESSFIKVYVAGEVNNPGVIELEEGSRIEDAIEGAGGVKAEANLKNINLAYAISDGEKIYIPNIAEAGQETEESFLLESPSNGNIEKSSKGKININKATATELTSVPGIGQSTAQKIIAYREENGKFQAIEDVKKVSGIGDSKFESMKDYLSVK